MRRKIVFAALGVVAAGLALLFLCLRESDSPASRSSYSAPSIPWTQRSKPLRARVPAAPIVEAASLAIRAVDVETAETIASASFHVTSRGLDEALPAAAGTATVACDKALGGEIRVSAPGYTTARRPLMGGEGEIVVALKRRGAMDIVVLRGPPFEPVVGATVVVSPRLSSTSSPDAGDGDRAATTSDRGIARFDGVDRTGSLDVEVRAAGSPPARFVVPAAQERTTITLPRTVPANVLVVDEHGTPIPSVLVRSYGPTGRRECEARTDDAGRCLVSCGDPVVSDGRHRIVAAADDGRKAVAYGAGPARDETVRIVLRPVVQSGVRVFRDGRAAAGAKVAFAAILPFRVEAGTQDLSATTDADGRAAVAPINGAAYAVSVESQELRASSRVFGADSLAAFPEIVAQATRELRISVVDDAGAPVPGAVVRAETEDRMLEALAASGQWRRPREIPSLGETGAAGRLTARVIAGVRLALSASRPDVDSDWLYVDDAAGEATLQVVRRELLVVQVVDTAGAALAGADVVLVASGIDARGEPIYERAERMADREGRAAFSASRAHELSLSATVDGTCSEPVKVDDAALRSGRALLVVPRPRTARIRVVDGSGRPVSGVLVVANSQCFGTTIQGQLTDDRGVVPATLPDRSASGSTSDQTTTIDVEGPYTAYVTAKSDDVVDGFEIVARKLEAPTRWKVTVAPAPGLPQGEPLLCFTQAPGGRGRMYRGVAVVGLPMTLTHSPDVAFELVFCAANRLGVEMPVAPDAATDLTVELPEWREIEITNGADAVAAVMIREVSPGREMWFSPPILPGGTARTFVRNDARYEASRSDATPTRWRGRALRDTARVIVTNAGVEVR